MNITELRVDSLKLIRRDAAEAFIARLRVERSMGTYEPFQKLPAGWARPKNVLPHTLKVIARNEELGIVAKVYAPILEPEVARMYEVLRALSQLSFTIPVLGPIDKVTRGFLFEMGQLEHEMVGIGKLMTSEERETFIECIQSYGLKPADTVDTLIVGEKRFLVDPYQDGNFEPDFAAYSARR